MAGPTKGGHDGNNSYLRIRQHTRSKSVDNVTPLDKRASSPKGRPTRFMRNLMKASKWEGRLGNS